MNDEPKSEGTRASLLGRLADSPDDPAWAEFDRIYRAFIEHICREMGLSEEDAKDVRQEVMADLVQKLPEFRYDPAVGKFRGWLRQRVRWKVWDLVRRRSKEAAPPVPGIEGVVAAELAGSGPESSADDGFERLWDREWQNHLLGIAKAALKKRVSVQSYQVFDLVVVKELSVREVAALFGLTENNVYKIRHDVEAMLSEELGRMREWVKGS